MKHQIVYAGLLLAMLAIGASGCGVPGNSSGNGDGSGGGSGGGGTAKIEGLPSSTSSGVDQGMRIIDGIGRMDGGYLYLPGVVENTTDKPVLVTLHVYLYDSSDKELAAESTLGEPSLEVSPWMVIPPHGKGPFFYLRDQASVSGTVARYKFAVQTVVEMDYHAEASVSDVKWTYSGGFVELNAKVTSTAGDPCTAAMVYMVSYLADGRIYRVDNASFTDAKGTLVEALAVGQSGQLSTYLIEDPQQVIAKVEVYPACGLLH